MLLRSFLQNNLRYSRRSAFDLIRSWWVRRNSITVLSFLEHLAVSDVVEVRINGLWEKYIVSELSSSLRVVLFHKPVGYVVSKSDSYNTTIFALLPPWWSDAYYYVGRLDKDSHGLLLLVSSSTLVNQFEHPSKNFVKVYHVTVSWIRNESHAAVCLTWLWVDKDSRSTSAWLWDFLQFSSLSVVSSSSSQFVLKIGLSYGKNRHIRRLLWALFYKILDLCRVSFGPYFLGGLAPWAYRVEYLP